MSKTVTINSMEFREWNIIDELNTEKTIIGFLTSVFDREHTTEEVREAIAIAVQVG